MTEATLADRCRAYIACLNNRELSRLGDFVADDVAYNGERDNGVRFTSGGRVPGTRRFLRNTST